MLVGYKDLSTEDRVKISTTLEHLAKELKLSLYDWGGGSMVAPSPGEINGEAEAFMFAFEKETQ